jgi:hypothetical protein
MMPAKVPSVHPDLKLKSPAATPQATFLVDRFG